MRRKPNIEVRLKNREIPAPTLSIPLFSFSSMAQQIERNQEATVYVGNLDERCTDSLIWELMLQAGPVGKLECTFGPAIAC